MNTVGLMVTGTMENTTKVNRTVTATTVAKKVTATSVILQTAFFTAKDNLRSEQLIGLATNMRAIFTKVNFMAMVLIFMPMEIDLWVDFDLEEKMVEVFFIHMMEKRFRDAGGTTS